MEKSVSPFLKTLGGRIDHVTFRGTGANAGRRRPLGQANALGRPVAQFCRGPLPCWTLFQFGMKNDYGDAAHS